MKIKFSFVFYQILFLVLLTFQLFAQELYERKQQSLLYYINQQKKIHLGDRPKIALVLSGGGARGISHVGVFRGFEQLQIPLDLIVGTSMGSVLGGFYAAGHDSEQLEVIVRDIKWNDLFSDQTERENLFLGQKVEKDRYLLNIRFDGYRAYLPTSLTSGQKILSIISAKLADANFQSNYDFDNLKIPFRAIATDLISGKRVVIDKGDLAEAINASVAVPLLFAPVVWEEKLLVDGGISSNFAVDVARSLGMDIIIVVDITSPLRKRDELNAPWKIADQVTSIMQQSTNQEQMNMADLVLKPDLEGVGNLDFDKVDKMISEGIKAVLDAKMTLGQLTKNRQTGKSESEFHITKFIKKQRTSLNLPVSREEIYADNKKSLSYAMIKDDIDNLFSCGMINRIHASLEADSSDTILTYDIYENTEVCEIQISGNNSIPDNSIFEMIEHPMGRTLNVNVIAEDLFRIREYYLKSGYTLMRYKEVEYDSLAGRLTIDINEGIIDGINISGNINVKDYVIFREFLLTVNDIFHSRLARNGIANIYNTQLFDKVSINLDRVGDKNNLIIKVEEKKYTVLRVGGKAGIDRGAQIYLDLANENFLNIGGKVSLQTRFGDKDRRIGFDFRMDRIFESYITIGFSSYYDWKLNPFSVNNQKIGRYKEERRGGRLSFGQQLEKLGQLSVELRLENVTDNRFSGEFTKNQSSELRTLKIRSITDKRDKIGFTTNGIYNLWYWETGNERILEGQEKYTKAYVGLEAFYTYAGQHTFHLKGGVGVADLTLPFSEYFRIGGLNSFIGFNEYEKYGRQVIYSNLEYRYKLPFKIVNSTYLAVRYDIGGIWETPDLVLKGEDFFNGYGAWLGIETVFGPLIFGYGDASLREGVFYLSLGYNF